MPKAEAIFREVLDQLKVADEKMALAYRLLDDGHGITKKNIVCNDDVDAESAQISSQIDRLNNSEPIQYILGFTYFCGHRFQVNHSVLIPRPETEEIIHWLKNQKHTSKTQILDVGTGSGCIAISAALALPNAQVIAIDVSADALEIAKTNAENLQAKVSFQQIDFLTEKALIAGKFDLILSNPPYISQQEIYEMQTAVTAHEPHLALFVPDENPLIFYKHLAEMYDALTENGKIFAEINQYLAAQTKEVFDQKPFKKVSILNDIFDNPRFVLAEK